jgi:hypothetical protein
VWVLSPWRLNQLTVRRRTVPMASHSSFEQYTLTEYDQTTPAAKLPLAVNVHHTNERIRAQDSAFTVHGSQAIALETIVAKSGGGAILAKIEIPRSRCGFIKRELYAIGIHRGRLFPDLPGLAAEIGYRYSVDFWAPDVSLPMPERIETAEKAAGTVAINAAQLREMMAAQPPTFNVPSTGEFMALNASDLGVSATSRDSARAIRNSPVQVPEDSVPGPAVAAGGDDFAARALAESLLLEIKNAYPDELSKGIKGGDLGYRLGTQIQSARNRFNEQLSGESSPASAIFDEQLVRILAGGDRNLLRP